MQLVRGSPFRDLLVADKEFSKMMDRSWGLAQTLADVSAVDMYIENGKLISEAALQWQICHLRQF